MTDQRPLMPPESRCQNGSHLLRAPPGTPAAAVGRARPNSCVPKLGSGEEAFTARARPGNAITWQGRGPLQLCRPDPSAGPPRHHNICQSEEEPPGASSHTAGDHVAQEKNIRPKPSLSNRNPTFICKKIHPDGERRGSLRCPARCSLLCPAVGFLNFPTGHRMLIRPRKKETA